MADIVPRTRPPYLHRFVTRHGKVIWYFRKRGEPAIRLPGVYGSAEFMAAYQSAAAGQVPAKAPEASRMSLSWCIQQFRASHEWASYAAETHKQMGYQFGKIEQNAGHVMVTDIRRHHIMEARQRRSATPSDANKYVRAMQMLCKFCVDREWIQVNPATGIAKLKTSRTGEGFYTWRPEDLAAFENRWPLGTTERLAYEIIVGTGIRRGDVRKFGAQHIKGGSYVIRTGKTGMIVEGTVSPRLAAAIKATATGDMVFLVTSHGKPFQSSASFGNWFGEACRAAGVAGSAHGIRKGVASIAAEKGISEAQLNSFFGWAHGSGESATYIAKASRAKMAAPVGRVIAQTVAQGLRKKRASD